MNGQAGSVVVWDPWVRVVHWLLAALVAFSWWSAEEGQMDWHLWSGIAILGLLLFRMGWGLVGSETARFASFVKGPRAIRDYLAGHAVAALGHNPLGALSVLALLGVLLVQVVLGLFAQDEDGLFSGPLARFIDYDLSSRLGELHHDLFDVVLVLVGLHVVAILFYALVKRNNLVRPMLTGRLATTLPAPRQAPALRALLVAALSALLSWWVFTGLRGL